MGKQPFPPCPNVGTRMNTKECIWENRNVLERSNSQTFPQERVEYTCRFCNQVKQKIEKVGG